LFLVTKEQRQGRIPFFQMRAHLWLKYRRKVFDKAELKAKFGGCVIAKKPAAADVPAQVIKRAVPRLPHDVKFPCAVHVGLRAEASSQTVAGVDLGIQAGRAGGPFHQYLT
jgi:hypothetical protein